MTWRGPTHADPATVKTRFVQFPFRYYGFRKTAFGLQKGFRNDASSITLRRMALLLRLALVVLVFHAYKRGRSRETAQDAGRR